MVRNGDANTSVVVEHAWQYQHRMDWSASTTSTVLQDTCLSRGTYQYHTSLTQPRISPCIHRPVPRGLVAQLVEHHTGDVH